jgi:hypothetical protein
MSAMRYMLITASPGRAAEAERAGVDRIFVDLEILGKRERQTGRSTVISGHSLEDAGRVGRALRRSELLVRLNPLHDGTAAEIEGALAAGARHLMLPMFRSAAELGTVSRRVAGRARLVGLVETRESAERIDEIAAVEGLSEIYVGLNDLSLSLGLAFLFEPLASGLVDRLSEAARRAGLPFGFGGVARVGEGLLPAELVLGEHLRLGSTAVILSRAFHEGAGVDLALEVGRLREAESALSRRTPEEVERDRRKVRETVGRIAREKRR